MKLIIAGDLTLQDRAFRRIWNDQELERAFFSVRNLTRDYDYAIVNLESPVTDCNMPIVKDGPSLKNPAKVFDIMRYCGFGIATLANNHLRDYGDQGVMDTIHRCKGHSIMPIGAGSCMKTARKPLALGRPGRGEIGIINVCEHESSIASSVDAGANPFDLSNLYYDIRGLKEKTDKVIVIIHGGREHYNLPTPKMKREYHLIADFGADVIVNHHQHCFSGYEIYNGKPIFYGLGNFFFDRPKCRNSMWNQGLLLQLELTKDMTDFRLIPYEQCNDEAVVKIRDYDSLKPEIEKLNSIIANDDQLEMEFEKMAAAAKPLYPFLPFGNKVIRSLYFRGWLKDMISKRNKALLENHVSCETHREVLLQYLKSNR